MGAVLFLCVYERSAFCLFFVVMLICRVDFSWFSLLYAVILDQKGQLLACTQSS